MKKGFVKRNSFLTIAALLLSLFAFTPKADAVQALWTCLGTTNYWDDTSCWDTGIVPGAGDTAYITNYGIDVTHDTTTVDYRNSSNPSLIDFALGASEGWGSVIFNQSQDDLTTSFSYITPNTEFNQSGGTHTTDLLQIIGTYNLSGTGALTVGTEIIGDYRDGVFNQTGGTHTVTNNLYLGLGVWGEGGLEFTSIGTYYLSGGSLSANYDQYIGFYGTGVFTQTGGTHTVTGELVLGNFIEWLIVGDGTTYSPGSGTYNQSGGTTVAGELILGNGSLTSGTYNLNGTGTLLATNETIGNSGTGAFYQSAGTNAVSSDLFLGYNYRGNGIYNLSGTGTLSAAREFIGYDGTGTFTQSGGSNATDLLELGQFTGSSGTYYQTGGTNTVSDTLTIAVNPGSAGMYFLSGGTLTVQNGGGTGEIINNDTFNFAGGNLNVDTFTNNADFNISGGGTRVIIGNVTSNGQININADLTVTGDFFQNGGGVKVTGAEVHWLGTSNLMGQYWSDPSDNYFTDLTVGNTGYLVGGVGDNFFISGDFFNNSTEGALWDTVDAYLGFTGAGAHEFSLADWLDPESYGWGTLELLDGGDLTITGGLSASLWVGDLILSAGSILDLGGYDLFYTGTFTDFGGTVTGGTIAYTEVAVPEPATLLLLGSGLIGLAFFRRKEEV